LKSLRRLVLAGGATLLALAALLLWFVGPTALQRAAPVTELAQERPEGSAAQRVPARSEAAAADAEGGAARLALDAAQQALGLLGSRPGSELSRRDALRLALDPAAQRVDRVRAFRALARLGDAEALDVLERVLRGESPDEIVRQAAVALGYAAGPAADRLLADMLGLDGGPARLGAIEALGLRAGAGDVDTLKSLLLDASEDPAAREAAAEALAGIRAEGVLEALGRVLAEGADDGLADRALSSLAARPWQEAGPLLRALLADPQLDSERELEVLEALSESSSEAADLLFEYARNAPSPEARSVAVESLAMLSDAEGLAEHFHRLSLGEDDPNVRSELYAAMALHADWEPGAADGRLVERVVAETTADAQLQGYRMLASRLRVTSDAELGETFDRRLVPRLEGQAADASRGRYERLMAVDTLKLAGTPAAREALAALASTRDPVVTPAAEKALEFPALP
jgi:HEAT repeat protein